MLSYAKLLFSANISKKRANKIKKNSRIATVLSLTKRAKDSPHGKHVTNASQKDKKVEHCMHIFYLMETIEDGTYNVSNAFAKHP